MFIDLKALLHLQVYTESGLHIGRVHDLELDIETHHVRHYIVDSGFFSKDYYLITPVQIKSITRDKMIVEDTVIKFEKGEAKKDLPPQTAMGNVSPRT